MTFKYVSLPFYSDKKQKVFNENYFKEKVESLKGINLDDVLNAVEKSFKKDKYKPIVEAYNFVWACKGTLGLREGETGSMALRDLLTNKDDTSKEPLREKTCRLKEEFENIEKKYRYNFDTLYGVYSKKKEYDFHLSGVPTAILNHLKEKFSIYDVKISEKVIEKYKSYVKDVIKWLINNISDIYEVMVELKAAPRLAEGKKYKSDFFDIALEYLKINDKEFQEINEDLSKLKEDIILNLVYDDDINDNIENLKKKYSRYGDKLMALKRKASLMSRSYSFFYLFDKYFDFLSNLLSPEEIITNKLGEIKKKIDEYANGKIITDYKGLAEKLSELDFIKGNLVKERKGIYINGNFVETSKDAVQIGNKEVKTITITEPGLLLSSILNYYARTKAEEFLKEPTVKYVPSLKLKKTLEYLKKLEQSLKDDDKSILSQIRNTVIKAFKKLPQYASKESNPHLKEASKELRGIINGGRYEDIYKSLWEKNPIIFATKEESESALKNFYSGEKLLSPQEIWGILKYEATKEALKKEKPLIETLSRKGYNYDWNAVRMEIQKIYIGDTHSVSMGNNDNKDKDKEIKDYLESLGFASDEEINRIKNDYWIDAIRNVVSPPEQESNTEADDMIMTLNDLIYFDQDYDAKQKEEWKNIYSTIKEVKDEEYKSIKDDLINGKPLFKEDILKYIKYEETHDTLYLINEVKKRWAKLKHAVFSQ